jgi:two-component system sensor histidine kinase RpfC
MGAEKIDLAILDLNMPDMSGPDVIKLFRASSIGANRLPIMILSADATPIAKQESFEAGADEFVTKPVTAATLLATIERMMAGSAARGQQAKNIHDAEGTVRTKPHIEAAQSLQSTTSMLVDTDRIAAVRRIARGDIKFLDTYVNAAVSELEQAIGDLRLAVRKRDCRAVRDHLHIIEGTGASVGAVALVANCKSIREYIDVPDDPDRASALAELSTTYTLTKSTVLASLHSPRESGSRSGAKADKMP